MAIMFLVSSSYLQPLVNVNPEREMDIKEYSRQIFISN